MNMKYGLCLLGAIAVGFAMMAWLYGKEDIDLIPRPALHSYALHMTHPVTGEDLHLTAPLPEDMQKLL